MPLLSIVSPVYEAEECVEELYLRISEAVSQISNDYEIIFVEDGGESENQYLYTISNFDIDNLSQSRVKKYIIPVP